MGKSDMNIPQVELDGEDLFSIYYPERLVNGELRDEQFYDINVAELAEACGESPAAATCWPYALAWARRSDQSKLNGRSDRSASNFAARHCPCKDDPRHQHHGSDAHQIPIGLTLQVARNFL